MPRISVGLPVYNGENYLAQALDAILAQTFADFELIISDNASTDRTPQICRAYAEKDSRIRHFRQEKNLGAIANYNFVCERAGGEYFKWAAHDDLIAPAYLEKCVAVMERQPEVVLCFDAFGYIDADGRLLRHAPDHLSLLASDSAERLRNFVHQQNKSTDIFWAIFGLIRTRALQASGLFDTYVASDRVLLMKLLLRGGFYQLPEPLFFRREHAAASTIKLPQMRRYRESAKWYDTRSRVKIVLPNWRLIAEYLAAVRDCELEQRTKARCYCLVGLMSTRKWRNLGYELASIPAQVLGCR